VQKHLNKKAQVTVFIILGLILLFSAGAVIYMKLSSSSGLEAKSEQMMTESSASLSDFIDSCIVREAAPLIRQMAVQGGTLSLETDGERQNKNEQRAYNGSSFRYLCKNNQAYENCVSVLLTRSEMEAELAEKLNARLKECIELERFREQGMTIKEGEIKISAAIGQDDITITLNYPLEIIFSETTIKLSEFTKKIELPLGKLFDLSTNIINEEITNGFFDQDSWMKEHGAEVIIEKHRPYPDIVYSLEYSSLIFNFALQGRETVKSIGMPTVELQKGGCCRNTQDNTCYSNAIEEECSAKQDMIFENNPETGAKTCNCPGFSRFTKPGCSEGECRDCEKTWDYNMQDYVGPRKKHGESWCVYDGAVGRGFDFVGSRHYKHSCINGIEYVEECRDFREEMCAEQRISGKNSGTKAVCRPNRWQTCSIQTSKEECTDQNKRDCTWTESLVNEAQQSYGLQRNKQCHPSIPPGFRHWELNGLQACLAASEWRYCDGLNCPDQWVNSVAQYCNFQGDCGNYRNIAGRITQRGYINSDNIELTATYLDPALLKTGQIFKTGSRIETRAQEPLTGNEFENPGHSPAEMMEEAKKYFDVVSSWDVNDIIQSYLTKGEIDVYVFGAGICGTWQAPQGNKDCAGCNAFKFKPCTEYKCRSLGQGCYYEEHNGTGICSSYGLLDGGSDEKPPVVEFDDTQLTPGFEGLFTTFGRYDGIEITPSIKPKTKLIIPIKTDEPASCVLAPMPGAPAYTMPSFIEEFAGGLFTEKGTVEYTISHNITLRGVALREAYERISDVRDTLRIYNISESETFLENYKELMNSLGSKYSIDVSAQVNALDKAIQKTNMELVQQIIEDALKGKYRLFVRCTDRAGNTNTEELFIQVSFEDSNLADIEPPKLVNITPKNGTIAEEDFVEVALALDEFAECRYNFFDEKEYEEMAYNFKCPSTSYVLSAHTRSAGGDWMYECKARINLTGLPYGTIPVFIKCKDNPYLLKKYAVKLSRPAETGVLEIADTNRYVNEQIELVEPSTARVKNANILLGMTKEIKTNAELLNLELNFTKDVVCRFINMTTAINFEQMSEMVCSLNRCLQIFEVNNQTYQIKCHNRNVPARNVGSYAFELVREVMK
jgi:hypothetical protein